MALTIVETRPITGGVDTHADVHVAAALDPIGGLLGVREFPATTAGYAGLLGWLGEFGTVCLVGIEGTGSYGAGLSRHVTAAGVRVVEVDRSDRQDRRRQGKSDPLDAVSAARAAQSGRARGAPKGRDGSVEAIRALMVARRSAIGERTRTINQARALVLTGPDDLRARFARHTAAALVAELAPLRPRPGDVADYAVRIALRELGRRARFLDGQLERLDELIGPLVTARAPGLLALYGDVLRIEAINDDGSVTVRPKLERDPQTGQRQWGHGTFRYRGYGTADLAYASTAHTAQGRTVTSGITLVTGGESRQWLYSAMTRAAESNIVCAFTSPAKLPDPQPGTRPAPELARHERLAAERAGLPFPEPVREGDPVPREHLAVLADVLARDSAELSALEAQRRNLANADHLARLDAMWRDQVGALEKDRYRQAVRALLPADVAGQVEASYCAPWLWRTLRAAEAAGLNAAEVAGQAVRERPLDGARDVAAVLDARIRQAVCSLRPAPWAPWAERVPDTADPGQGQFLRELAAAMDGRRQRIGEHAAETSPQWAVAALGPVPADPVDRLDWEQRAAHVGAYRELYGWEHPSEPCGPEPAGDSPEKRAAWHAAYAAMTRTEGLDLRGEADGTLFRMRGTYEAETAWAPPHVAGQLRAVRCAIIDTTAAAARADAEAAAARDRGEHELALHHQELAGSSRALEAFYRQREAIDAGLMEDYQAWEKLTAGSRHVAVLADAELRRRQADPGLDPLRSAEPAPPAAQVPELPGGEAEWRAIAGQARLQRQAFRDRLEERQGVQIPAEDPDYAPEGEAWPAAWSQRDRDAVLQPPQPEMRPAPQVERAADKEAAL